MKKKIVISGFGGQGVMSVGKNLVEAGMAEGYYVTWAPSYGPEMRGGTANCHVGISTSPIGAPMFTHPTELIAMNGPSIEKFGPKVAPGGMIFINSSVVAEKFEREDVSVYYVPCEAIAEELGNKKAANMVMLGAFLSATGTLKLETVEQMIHAVFAGAKEKLIPLNIAALHRGAECVK